MPGIFNKNRKKTSTDKILSSKNKNRPVNFNPDRFEDLEGIKDPMEIEAEEYMKAPGTPGKLDLLLDTDIDNFLNKKIEEARRADEENKKNNKTRDILRWVFSILAAILLGALTSVAMFQSVTMQESSMQPTISIGDTFFINRVSYLLGPPQRGDIIVYKANGSDESPFHISRVIGLPEETIQIVNNRILINGEPYNESGEYPDINSAGLAANPVTLGKEEYFVLGDNRNNSEDSRYATIGNVNAKYIQGKIWFQSGPIGKMGFVK